MFDKRVAFIDTLMVLAERDRRIVLIVADVGFKHADRFKEKFPDRYLNLGVTEQSIVIIAAGMALAGMKPWVYSMSNFVLYRPYEMVRNGIVFHNANVKLIGVSGAGRYGFLGRSHNDAFDGEHIKTAETLGLRVRQPIEARDVSNVVLEENADPTPVYIPL